VTQVKHRILSLCAALALLVGFPALASANVVNGTAVANSGSAQALVHRSPTGQAMKTQHDGVVYIGVRP
jgi:hypothetical protein